jgi:hypothetical protein
MSCREARGPPGGRAPFNHDLVGYQVLWKRVRWSAARNRHPFPCTIAACASSWVLGRTRRTFRCMPNGKIVPWDSACFLKTRLCYSDRTTQNSVCRYGLQIWRVPLLSWPKQVFFENRNP